MNDPFANIALVARSESRFFLLALARSLKTRFDSNIHLYCGGQQELLFYEKQNRDGLFASINNGSVILARVYDKDLDEAAVIEKARNFEKKIGKTINTLAVPDRHMGRGYALGGFHHPRSRYSETVDYVHMVHAFNETLDFWDREFTEKSITLILNGGREAANIARAHGIPYRTMVGSRYRNLHYWSHNEFYENPEFEEAFHEIRESALTMDAPYHAHQAVRTGYYKKFRFSSLLKNLALTTARHAWWNLRRYEKAKGYYYLENMKYFYRYWRDYKKLCRLATATLDDLAGKKFVFFPLHIEPETALHGLSPEYFYQLALIAAVSRDLPAGTFLAVKEAYGAVGRRPDNFYRQISDLKNVVLLDTWEIGFDCARKADAVITICGTAGMEGAVSGTPVIAFGKHNIYNFLPLVTVVNDESNLAKNLSDALDDSFDKEAAIAVGRRFLEAIVACSFDMGKYDYINLHNFESESVQDACDALERSLSKRTDPVRAMA